jgi:hypothetical protein
VARDRPVRCYRGNWVASFSTSAREILGLVTLVWNALEEAREDSGYGYEVPRRTSDA